MADRRQEFRVGIVALATVVISALLVSLNAGTSLQWGAVGYTIRIKVDRAPGVGPNTPIRKDGVRIGRVVKTEFVPGGGVMVTAAIDKGAPIYRSDSCRIQPSSLFGDAVINFSYPGGTTDATPIEPGAEIEGAALPDPIEALTSLQVEVGPSIRSIGDAAEGVTQLTSKLNAALGEDFASDRVEGLLDQSVTALNQFTKTMEQVQTTVETIDGIVSDPKLKATVDSVTTDVPAILADARATVSRAVTTIDEFGGVVRSAETNLKNLEGLTGPLGERGPELAQQVTEAIGNLNIALKDIAQIAAALNGSQGTFARLVNDPALYDNVQTLVGNMNVVLANVNERVKEVRPVIYDARVFMDKIAREPGTLIGGAIKPGPGLK
jgi:phospholipid/cholesterol/gamma-HCH transport system substrate-binding protein